MEFKREIFPFACFEMLLLTILIVLSIIGKSWQPLKSRGSTFMMGILLLVLQIILEILPLFYSVSFGYYNDLYILAMFTLPIEVNIKLLIVIVNTSILY